MKTPLNNFKNTILVMLTLVTFLSLVTPAMAQEYRVAPGGIALSAPSQQLGPTDPAELDD